MDPVQAPRCAHVRVEQQSTDPSSSFSLPPQRALPGLGHFLKRHIHQSPPKLLRRFDFDLCPLLQTQCISTCKSQNIWQVVNVESDELPVSTENKHTRCRTGVALISNTFSNFFFFTFIAIYFLLRNPLPLPVAGRATYYCERKVKASAVIFNFRWNNVTCQLTVIAFISGGVLSGGGQLSSLCSLSQSERICFGSVKGSGQYWLSRLALLL